MLLFFFFFSSRRRHTRCLSDWSSDVCSSDLVQLLPVGGVEIRPVEVEQIDARFPHLQVQLRSEERRVGKECRSRWWRDQYMRKKTRNKNQRVGRKMERA